MLRSLIYTLRTKRRDAVPIKTTSWLLFETIAEKLIKEKNALKTADEFNFKNI